MLRRQFLSISGLALVGPAMEWADTPAAPLIAAARGDRVTPESVDLVETNITALRRLDDAGSGTYALNATESQLALVIHLLRDGRYDARIAKRLHSGLANLAQLAGYICQDHGDDARAQRYYLTALHAAHSADDKASGAHILSCMARQARRMGRPHEAQVLLGSALSRAAQLSPGVRSLLTSRLARVHAEAGDESACGAALNQAERLLDHARREDEPDWLYWLIDAPVGFLQLNKGHCFAAFGISHLGRAERYLDRGTTIRSAYPRDRAVDLPALAQVQRRRGEIDQACATATKAYKLCEQTGTQRGLSALRDFRARLPATSHTPAIRDFLSLTHPTLAA
jgi:hypothetical protein